MPCVCTRQFRQRNMFALSQKLCSTCYAINAKARYKKQVMPEGAYDEDYE